MKQRENKQLDVNWLNQLALQTPDELVSLSEHLYRNQITMTADSIADNQKKCSVLLVSGPSASSKTTTALKLSQALSKREIHSVVISLDDFFIDRRKLPLLPDGKKDFESIESIDFETLSDCLSSLLKTHKAQFPIYNFALGKRSEQSRWIEINEHSILIMEGIHALNPRIAKGHDPNGFLKLYISPDFSYDKDGRELLNGRKIRLIRRLVRDYFHRGNSVLKTLDMWDNVVKSEQKNIIPYRTEADFTINSAILYEPNIYEFFLERILSESTAQEKEQPEIQMVREALSQFVKLEENFIPKDTVLHEFLE